MIRVKNIVKSFGSKRALDNVTFSIEQGEYVALLGANGAGKTTLTRILATLSRPSSGDVMIAGHSKKEANLIRQKIGVMSHYSFLYDDLTAEENLLFYARMYDVPEAKTKIHELLKQVDLMTRRYDKVGTFSRGMQQRLSLARAILHDPPILLLDEPFAGLDINAAEMVKALLDELIAKDKTVLLTVHDINYAMQNSSRLLMLKQGALVVDSATREMTREQVREVLIA
jgi:heme exporter protein A